MGKKSKRKTPSLYEAAACGDTEVIQGLIAAGASVNGKNADGESALMLACQNGHAEVAKWLALAGANLEEKDAKMGTTALMFACIGGHYAAVRELLKAGANPDVRFDSEDNAVTPLMFATQYSGLMRAQKQPWAYFGAVVNILLKGGASVDLKDKKGRTALMFAAELGHPEVTGWLIEAGAELEAADQNGTRPLMYACKGAHVEVARVLLGAGADPTSANTKGSNALHFAASGGSLPIIRLLLEKGCDVDSANLDGDTSLGLAISAGKVGAVGYLVERADASLDITDKEGRSSLDLAAIMFSLFPEESRQVLLQYLQGKGARFQMIDEGFIQESHEKAMELGVTLGGDKEKEKEKGGAGGSNTTDGGVGKVGKGETAGAVQLTSSGEESGGDQLARR